MKTVIFFDIDGTLLPPGEENLEDSTIKAIEKLQENNVEVVACTGRCVGQAKKFIDQAKINSYITSNGQEVTYEGKRIYHFEFSDEHKKELFDQINNHGLHKGYENSDCIYIAEENENEVVKTLIDNEDLLETKISSEYINDGIKQVWAFGDKEKLDKLNKQKINHNCYRWSDCSMQIAPFSENKGKGIEKFLEEFRRNNFDEEIKTYGFGDSLNDFALFKKVDVKIAMGNASDELKKEADYITDKSGENGISNILKKLKLIS